MLEDHALVGTDLHHNPLKRIRLVGVGYRLVQGSSNHGSRPSRDWPWLKTMREPLTPSFTGLQLSLPSGLANDQLEGHDLAASCHWFVGG